MSKERILKSVIGQNTGKTREDEGFTDSFDTNVCLIENVMGAE